VKTKKKEVKPAMLKGFLIDPFKQEIQRIEISKDPAVWRAVLRCELLELVRLARPIGAARRSGVCVKSVGAFQPWLVRVYFV
jgi:hypothetical protein